MSEPVSKVHDHYLPGLDGLRTIAVFVVIGYHLNIGVTQGGLLGVDVFFVLSGYLITSLLLKEWGATGRIDMRSFWLRRARRLVPALIFMMVMVMAYETLFHRSFAVTLQGDVVAACLYVSNWWYIFHHESYFASFGPPSPFTHLWSLAVEEQFYVVWPLFLVVALQFVKRHQTIAAIILLAAFASALSMSLLYQPGVDPSRVYYGTDTRSFALLCGALLAVVGPNRRQYTLLGRPKHLALDLAGTASLLLILWMVWQTSEYNPFLYPGGLVIVSILSTVLVATLANPTSALGRILGCRPLRWLGVRSYGIYLWHYPVIALTSPLVNTNGLDISRAILQVSSSVLLAGLSYRFIEQPIREGRLTKLWTCMRIKEWHQPAISTSVILPAGTLVAFGVSCVGMMGPMSTANATIASVPTVEAHPLSPKATPGSSPALHPAAYTPHRATVRPNGAHPTHTAPRRSTLAGQGVTAIGDSVMIDAKPYLAKLLPGAVIDGKVGRQLIQTPTEIAHLKAEGKLGTRVIIELGTNGSFTQAQLTSLLKSLGKVQQIVLVNTRVPRPWQNVVNQTLTDVVATFPHTTLVNWYAASAGHDAYFYLDGVHLNPTGSKVYAALLAKALTAERETRR